MPNVTQFSRSVGGFETITAGTTQTQAGATQLAGGVSVVTVTTANDGVRLPLDMAQGDVIYVVNSSANSLNVYPNTGGRINNGTVNATKALVANMSGAYISLGSENWAAVLSA
jgi:hypothetical protein